MQETNIMLPADDEHQIPITRWGSKNPEKATVQIVHGMAEHSKRYENLAKALSNAGYVVYIHDQRGHGRSMHMPQRGHFADHNGWNLAMGDIKLVHDKIKKDHPDQKSFMLGHSLGSYQCQDFMIQHGKGLSGAILSGSNYETPLAMAALAQVPKFESWRIGKHSASPVINALSFGTYAKSVKPSRSQFDWLSRDARSVDQYLQDPWCGFLCTTTLWKDLLTALTRIYSRGQQQRIPKDLPVWIMGGSHDPISKGSGLERLAASFEKAAMTKVSLKIYEQGRHEMFHEVNKEEVYADLIKWLEERSPNRSLEIVCCQGWSSVESTYPQKSTSESP